LYLGSYERKGALFKKSLNHHTFKKRQFVLHGEQLFYYKKNIMGQQEKYFNLISLQNAKIALVEPTPELVKQSSKYKHCLKLENETRSWIIAA
jgi:hypothetical protein